MHLLKRLLADEDGQDMVEYGLVISLVVVGSVVIYQTLGTAIVAGLTTAFTTLENNL
jgi:Flp pilus assembly pilin Flp